MQGSEPEHTWRAGIARVHAQHVEHVAEVEPYRGHRHQYLTRGQMRCDGVLLRFQVCQGAPWLWYELEWPCGTEIIMVSARQTWLVLLL